MKELHKCIEGTGLLIFSCVVTLLCRKYLDLGSEMIRDMIFIEEIKFTLLWWGFGRLEEMKKRNLRHFVGWSDTK